MGYLADVFALANALFTIPAKNPQVGFLRSAFIPFPYPCPAPACQWFTKLHFLSTHFPNNTYLLSIHHITVFSKISIKSCNPVSKSIQKNDCCAKRVYLLVFW